MALRDADGNRLTKTQALALMSDVAAPPAKKKVNAKIYEDFRTSGASGSHFESQRQLKWTPGQEILATDVDKAFPAATATSITPATGPAAGDTPVTIKGTNLSGTEQVTFGGTQATKVKLVDNETLTCVTPAHAAGAVTVVVKDDNADVSKSNFYTYT